MKNAYTSRHSLASRPSGNRWGRIAAVAIGLAGLSAAGLCRADGPAAGPDPIALFDGKSLDGWEKTDFYRPGEVTIEDGAIVLHASPSLSGMTGITTTRRDLPTTDYELTYEALRREGRDFFAAATFPVGEAFLTFVNGGWGGNVTGLSSVNGADASENDTSSYVPYEDDRWYRFRVRVTDQRVRCWIDDEAVVDLDHRDRKLGTRLETRASQPLGFATWETTGVLRAIAIRRLSPEEVAETNREDD